MTFCQNLANLCAFDYREEKREGNVNHCVKEINENVVIISDNEAASLLVNTSILSKTTYSMKQDVGINELDFRAARYYMNGTFDKFINLEVDFLQCSNSVNEKTDYKKFGNKQMPNRCNKIQE